MTMLVLERSPRQVAYCAATTPAERFAALPCVVNKYDLPARIAAYRVAAYPCPLCWVARRTLADLWRHAVVFHEGAE